MTDGGLLYGKVTDGGLLYGKVTDLEGDVCAVDSVSKSDS